MSRCDGYDDLAELQVHSTTYGILQDPIRGRLFCDQYGLPKRLGSKRKAIGALASTADSV